MDKDVKMRVKIAMESLGISAYSIAKSCSINERTIYEQTNGSSRIGVSAVAALLSVSPDLSAEWLLRGTGEMLISSVDPTERTPRDDRETTDNSAINNQLLAQLQDLISEQKQLHAAALQEKDDKIQELKYYLELQKDYVDGQKRTIERLEQFIEHLQEENRELKKARTSAIEIHAKNA